MNTTKHIILFDGECSFCSFWVRYVIKRDKNDVFRFTSLQSDLGKELLKKFCISKETDSVVLIKEEESYIKSTAAFIILRTLGGFSSVFYVLIFIPKFIRDFFYDIMAGARYKLFGKEICQLPNNSNYKGKFL